MTSGWASPPRPPTPRQESAGTAAGKPHTASAAATRAGRGSGHPRGTGMGELPAYRPHQTVVEPVTTGTISTAVWAPGSPASTLVTLSNQQPQITAQYPPQNSAVSTLTPELIAAGTDDGQPNPTLQFMFALYNSAGDRIALSPVLSVGAWQVPAGTLAWGQSYAWIVQAFDGALWSASPPVYYFSVQVPQPPVTSRLSQNTGGRGLVERAGCQGHRTEGCRGQPADGGGDLPGRAGRGVREQLERFVQPAIGAVRHVRHGHHRGLQPHRQERHRVQVHAGGRHGGVRDHVDHRRVEPGADVRLHRGPGDDRVICCVEPGAARVVVHAGGGERGACADGGHRPGRGR